MAIKQIRVGKTASPQAQIALIAGDSDTQIIQLNVQRFDGGVDLAPLSWVVTAENAEGATEEYPIPETLVSAGMIAMQWRVKGTATAAEGITKFKLTGCAGDSDPVIWQSGTYHIRVNGTISHTPGSEQQQALSDVQKLIIYVDGELNGVIRAGQDAASAATDAASATVEARAAAEEAREAAKIASTGIESVVQTTTSTQDGGVNVVTITKTDGEKTTFEVRNGSKGSTGAAGSPGASVTVASVSESADDGGENVVTFSDGSALTVRNGSRGPAGKDGAAGKDGSAGADGASVTVSNVSQSTADGGSNVVTFSDGKTLTVKNGSKGSKGDTGAAGADGATAAEVIAAMAVETWTFTLSDGTSVSKEVPLV